MTLESIAIEIEACSQCPLNSGSYNPGLSVPGVGVGNPNVVLIGEAPGETEAETGLPFQGRAGMCLQAAVEQTNFTNFFITNIVKHRPPNNATPSKEIRSSCSQFLRKQINLIKPKAILALGRSAALGLAELCSLTIPTSGLRSYKFNYTLDKQNIPVICTWHPSYIIRGNDFAFVQLKEDLLLVKEIQNAE